MKFFTSGSIISPSSALSSVSLLVAGAALFYALSSHGSGGTVAIPPPRPLTPENPASALPHAEGLYPVSGVVESVTADAIVIREATNTSSSIKVGQTTQLYTQGKQKDPAVLQKDVAQFNDTLRAAMGSTAVFIAPPSYELNPIRISEIQPGVQVMVMVGGDGTAVQVTVLKSSGPQR